MGKTIIGGIKVPRCWKRLIEIMFTDGHIKGRSPQAAARLAPYPEKSGPAAVDDPECYYDDSRSVQGSTKGGGTVVFDLCSGQENYYGGMTIHNAEGLVVYETGSSPDYEVWSQIHDEEELVGEDGNIYVITIDWYGDDPYAQEK
jgi:hypothetical protein